MKEDTGKTEMTEVEKLKAEIVALSINLKIEKDHVRALEFRLKEACDSAEYSRNEAKQARRAIDLMVSLLEMVKDIAGLQ